MEEQHQSTAHRIDVENKIIDEINNGKLLISDHQQPLLHQSDQQSNSLPNDHRHELIDKIRIAKNKTLEDLNQLELQEQELRIAIKNIKKSNSRVLQRSEYSSQEKQKIKHILKLQKIKQEKQQKKHQRILKNFTNYLKQQRQQESRRVEKIREQRRNAAEKNLPNLQQRKKSREQFKKQTNQRLLELKKRKYIHIQKSQKDEEFKQQLQKIAEKKLQEIKQKFKLNLKQIEQHDKKYKQFIEQKSSERKRKQRLKTQGQKTIRKFSSNRFSRIIEQQQAERKRSQMKKLNIILQRRERTSQFNKYVKQKFIPKTSTHSLSEPKSFSTSPQKKESRILSHAQRIDQGNQYLKIAKKLRKQKDDPKLVTQPQIIKYMDYLKNIKKKRSGTVQQFRSIVNTEQSIDYPTATKALQLVESIQAKSKKTKDQKLFQSIQNKIDLLKVLL